MTDITIIDEEEEPQKKPSMIGRLIVPVIMILISGGAGFGFAKGYVAPMFDEQAAKMEAAQSMQKAEPDAAMKKDEMSSAKAEAGEDYMPSIVQLSPVVTNLADPTDVWVRAEFSLVFDQTPATGEAEQIQADFVSHLRTVKLQNLEGSSGFQHLIADLNDLAMMRSEQKVSRVLVRAFLVE